MSAASDVRGSAAESHGLQLGERFRRFAQVTSEALGRPIAFATALGLVVLWGVTGPIFHYSSTWQLVINTATTIVTFLMVFLLQNTQNRESLAIQLKLDELLRGTKGPRTGLVHLEDLSDAQLAALREEFEHLADHTAVALDKAAEQVEEELDERKETREMAPAGKAGK